MNVAQIHGSDGLKGNNIGHIECDLFIWIDFPFWDHVRLDTHNNFRAEDELAVQTCRDKIAMVLFTTNIFSLNILLKNIEPYWALAQESAW